MPFYLTPKQDDFNKIPELQAYIAEALYDVDSIVADPEALFGNHPNHLAYASRDSASYIRQPP